MSVHIIHNIYVGCGVQIIAADGIIMMETFIALGDNKYFLVSSSSPTLMSIQYFCLQHLARWF